MRGASVHYAHRQPRMQCLPALLAARAPAGAAVAPRLIARSDASMRTRQALRTFVALRKNPSDPSGHKE
ncbi:hypothetical protein VARIO8X_150032 [Burkholderiales bacterium 8X]|nr:hypothetical protein VARIO8X_150032 [Burkholderiales bacterium 8X]